MSSQGEISIRLTRAQTRQVAGHLAREAAIDGLLSGSARATPEALGELARVSEYTLSVSIVRGLQVLAAVPLDGGAVALRAVADKVGTTPSTTHRYIQTWVALGMVEQEPGSRRYRRIRDEVGEKLSRRLPAEAEL